MVKVGQLHCDWLRVPISWVIAVVLLSKLLDPLGDGQLCTLAVFLDVIVLIIVDLACEEVNGRLVLALLGLIGPEVFDFLLFDALLESDDAGFNIILDPSHLVELALLLGDHRSGLPLELLEHFGVVLLTLGLVLAELQLHALCVVGVLFDALVRLDFNLQVKYKWLKTANIETKRLDQKPPNRYLPSS